MFPFLSAITNALVPLKGHTGFADLLSITPTASFSVVRDGLATLSRQFLTLLFVAPFYINPNGFLA